MSASLPSPFRVADVMAAAQALVSSMEASDPDFDAATLRLALESETEAPEVLRRVVRVYQEAKSFAAATKERLEALLDRKRRFEAREQAARLAAFAIMQAMRSKREVQPEFTISILPGKKSVRIFDENQLPPEYVKIERTPVLHRISEDLTAGKPVPGAEMQRGLDVLRILSK